MQLASPRLTLLTTLGIGALLACGNSNGDSTFGPTNGEFGETGATSTSDTGAPLTSETTDPTTSGGTGSASTSTTDPTTTADPSTTSTTADPSTTTTSPVDDTTTDPSTTTSGTTSDDTTSDESSTTSNEIKTCADFFPVFQDEVAEIRGCTADAECGVELQGTSCGCTRNWVARLDADTTEFFALVDKANELGCELPFFSTCDCPNTNGFACEDNICTWNYI